MGGPIDIAQGGGSRSFMTMTMTIGDQGQVYGSTR